nr:hypothetical protein [Tanacetum cinerariifolium]
PQALFHTAPEGAGFPVRQTHFAADQKIPLEALGHGQGQSGVDGFKIGLQIEAQVPVVEVTGTHAYPIVHQHHFQMQETRLVFEDFDPGPEQTR